MSANEDNFFGAPLETNISQNIEQREQHDIINENHELSTVEKPKVIDDQNTIKIVESTQDNIENKIPLNIKIYFWIFILSLIMIIMFFGYRKYNS